MLFRSAEAEKYLAQGADFLIFTGGMSVDPDDLTPGAIRRLGAEIVTHGVPAQPGNMTLIAYRDGVTMMGVPGSAISVPVNENPRLDRGFRRAFSDESPKNNLRVIK